MLEIVDRAPIRVPPWAVWTLGIMLAIVGIETVSDGELHRILDDLFDDLTDASNHPDPEHRNNLIDKIKEWIKDVKGEIAKRGGR
jgi:hypothetical protein